MPIWQNGTISSSGTVEGSLPSKASFPPMSKTLVLYLSFGGRKPPTAAIRAPGNDKMLVFGNSKCRVTFARKIHSYYITIVFVQ